MRRLSVSLSHEEALRATRVFIGKKKLVYVLVADKRLHYPKAKSRIAYIGTTRSGSARVAGSAAKRGDKILGLHGVREFRARIVTCKPRRRIRTWIKLEHALLLEFKQKFGKVPMCNGHGSAMIERDEFKYFARSRVSNILEELS